MESFNDNLSPDQLKMLTLQFMGQHLTGELKELDKNLISKTNTLRGMALDPTAVINSINATAPIQSVPVQSAPVQTQTQPQLQFQQPSSLPFVTTLQPLPTLTSPQQPTENQDQLEFSFETSPLSERIFNALERIEKNLFRIEERLFEIEEFKKKD